MKDETAMIRSQKLFDEYCLQGRRSFLTNQASGLGLLAAASLLAENKVQAAGSDLSPFRSGHP